MFPVPAVNQDNNRFPVANIWTKPNEKSLSFTLMNLFIKTRNFSDTSPVLFSIVVFVLFNVLLFLSATVLVFVAFRTTLNVLTVVSVKEKGFCLVMVTIGVVTGL